MQIRKAYCFMAAFILLLKVPLCAQLENAHWAIQGGKQLSTNTSPATSGISALPNNSGNATSISDGAGNLLLYTLGPIVYNGSHVAVANGTGLNAGRCVIAKLPGSSTVYYVFTLNLGSLYYSVVDISLAAGQGSVTAKNVLVTTFAKGPMDINGVRHCNGTDFWIVTPVYLGSGNIEIQARQFSSGGINTTPVTGLYGPMAFPSQGSNLMGKLTFSPRKNKLAFGVYSEFGLMDFDPATGVASNSLSLGNGTNFGLCYGTEFSPDGSKLYGIKNATYEFYQWDLCAGSPTAILASKYQINIPPAFQNTFYADACLGVDGKIYLPHSGFNMSVINSPNLPGAACNIVYEVQPPAIGGLLLQNFIKTAGFHLPPPPFTYTLQACQTVNFVQAPVSSVPISYCNSVQGNFTGILWNFGDPSSGAANYSTLNNPSHMFSAPGTYTVQLYRLNSCSLSTDTSTQIINIPGPSITISISSSITCASLGTATVSVPSATTSYNYTWMPSFQSGPVATGLSPGTYTVFLAAGSSTCDHAKIFQLVPTGIYNFNVASSASINCKGPNTATAQVVSVTGGSGNQSYWWTNGSQSFTTATVYSLSVGSWTVMITDALTHCQSTQTLFIHPAPPYNLVLSSSSATACAGGSISLSGVNLGGSAGTTYTWSNGANTASTNVSEPAAGTYVYTLSSETINQCFATSIIAVQFIANPILTLVSTSVCPNASTVLTAGGNGTAYQWSGGPGLNAANTATVLVSPPGTQVYTVTSFAGGCSTTGTVMLFLLPSPEITIVRTKDKVCAGDSIYLSGTGGQVYEWKGPLGFHKSGKQIRFKATDQYFAGEYTLSVTDQLGCQNVSVTAIEVLALPGGNLVNFTGDACAPYCVTYIFAPNSGTNTTALWTLNNSSYPGNTFSACLNQAGTYTLSGTLENTSTGCRSSQQYVLNLHPKPEADFSSAPEKPIESVDEVQFTNTSRGEAINKFSWYFYDNSELGFSSIHASYLYPQAGNYPVALVAENGWACKDTVIKVISVAPDFALYIPNAFTPDGDGLNDVFLPITRAVKLFDLRIYNRWGEQLFHSGSPGTGWDGTFAGSPCKEDVYTWLMEISTTNGEALKKSGMVLLLR